MSRILRLIARRALHGIALLWAASVLIFLLAELVPGDLLAELRLDARTSDETIELIRARWGLDDPVALRYLRWMGSVLRGDMGYSLLHDMPVGPLLAPRLGRTLLLGGVSLTLAWLLALPLGIWMAARRGGWVDRAGSLLTAALLAVPELVLALGALLLAATSGLFPLGGMADLDAEQMTWTARGLDLLHHLALPSLVLALAALPTLTRHVRSAAVAAFEEPFVQAARGHGVPPLRRLLLHVLPAAVHPLLTLFGMTFGALLSGSLVVEMVFGWPGLGPLFLEAILGRDLHVILATTLLSGALFIAGNLLADLTLILMDPRLADPRAQNAKPPGEPT